MHGPRLVNPSGVSAKKLRGRKGSDKARISTCKICQLAVFDTDDWKFYRQPTGINHVPCVEGGQ